MKKRTLLLGTCGDCGTPAERAKKKEKWKAIGNLLEKYNNEVKAGLAAGLTKNEAIASAGTKLMNIVKAYNNSPLVNKTGPLPYTSDFYQIDEALRDEYDQLVADCGFGS